jgi:hypothetical protein
MIHAAREASARAGAAPHPRLAASRGPTARQAGLVRDFKMAWGVKDIDALIGLLDPGATMTAGGGLAIAALRPIHCGEQVTRYLVDIAGRAPSLAILERRTVNGSPAWSPSTTASLWRCSRSRSQTPGSATSGRYATPASSSLGGSPRLRSPARSKIDSCQVPGTSEQWRINHGYTTRG